jgi:ABC-type uncharacterized transport system permease subunit
MDGKVLIAPLTGLITCFLTTYFSTNTTVTGALIVAITTAATVLVVNIIVERMKGLAKKRLNRHLNISDDLNA